MCIRCRKINPNTNKKVACQLTSEGREANQIEEDWHNVTSSWLSRFESISTSHGNLQKDHTDPEDGSGVTERKWREDYS